MGSHYQDESLDMSGRRPVSKQANEAHFPVTAPAQHQQHLKAIGILKDQDDRCIFACLDLVRSLDTRLQQCSDPACLTRDQVHAILALRHYKNNDISAWLHLARAPSVSGLSTWSASPLVSPPLDQGHSAAIVGPDASTTSSFNHSCDYQSNQPASRQGSSPQPPPTSTVTPPQAKAKYYCTVCFLYDRVRPFKNESDWKKHEKEHDTDYVCMRGGPREATSQGIQCAFCGIQDPDDPHLSGHNAQACSPSSLGLAEAFSTKRRYEMVSHLKAKHGINTAFQGEAIAGKWKYTVEKQAWSCCFCVKVFDSLNERLSHIATKHYEHGEPIEEWDATNVIQGLLQQPGVITAWQTKLEALPDFPIADIIWEKDAMKDLQHALEGGPSKQTTAVSLVDAAFSACRLNWGMENKRPRAVLGTEADGINDTALLPSRPLTSTYQDQA